MNLMQKPLADEYHANYQKYFDLVSEGAYLELLGQSSKETVRFFETIPSEKLDYKYAADKWTIKESRLTFIALETGNDVTPTSKGSATQVDFPRT